MKRKNFKDVVVLCSMLYGYMFFFVYHSYVETDLCKKSLGYYQFEEIEFCIKHVSFPLDSGSYVQVTIDL